MDIYEQRKLAGIEERGPGHLPKRLANCVTDVAPRYDRDTQRAFAICTSSLQKAGVLKPGTNELTAKGKKLEKNTLKAKGYETLLKAARNESVETLIEWKYLKKTKHARASVRPAVSGTEGELIAADEAALAPEVAELLSEDYRLLSGAVPKVKAFKALAWEDHQLPDQMNAKPLSDWKQKLSKKGFASEKGMQFAPDGDEEAAMKVLQNALIALALPTTAGTERQAEPHEFMYKGRHIDMDGKTHWVHFKHRGTRNMIHLDTINQMMVVPVRKELFQYGIFDKVEHAETYNHLRTLAGIR